MRFDIVKSRHSIKLDNLMFQTNVNGKITTPNRYAKESGFGTKKDVVDGIKEFDTSTLKFVLTKNTFPNFTKGNFQKIDNEYFFFTRSGYTDKHPLMIVDKTGLIKGSESTIKDKDWTSFSFNYINKETLPNTLELLNIKNAVRLDVASKSNKGFRYSIKNDKRDIAPVTGLLAREKIKENCTYETGDMVLVELNQDLGKIDFSILDGDRLVTKDNKELHGFFGDAYSLDYGGNTTYGTPWLDTKGRHDLGMVNTADPKFLEAGLTNIKGLGAFGMFGTKGKAFVLGGYRGAPDSITSDILISTITKGVLGNFTKTANFPIPIAFASVALTEDYVIVLGGLTSITPLKYNRDMYISKIDTAGNIGPFTKSPKALPKDMLSPNLYFSNNRLSIFGGGIVKDNKIVFSKGIVYSDFNGMVPSKWIYDNNDAMNFFGQKRSFDYSLSPMAEYGPATENGTYLRRLYQSSNNGKNKYYFTGHPDYSVFELETRSHVSVNINSLQQTSPEEIDKKNTVEYAFHNDGKNLMFGTIWQNVGTTMIRSPIVPFENDPTSRFYPSMFVTDTRCYLLGGLVENVLSSTNKSSHLSNYYTPINTNSVNDTNFIEVVKYRSDSLKDTFRLPSVRELLFNNKLYRLYVKK